MISLRQLALLLPTVVLLGSLALVFQPGSNNALAQGTPQPTPTNTGGGGGGGGDGDGGKGESPLGPPGAVVSGFVYDYSKAARQGGVTVMIDGGGWQAQTVSDSNGYYQFVNLGSGSGVLNLGLPPGAHSVAPNWPVSISAGSDIRVDLGYYWGDAPPMPVMLSSTLEDNILVVQVENRTGETVTGGLVDIRLPTNVKALPVVEASQGIVDYGEYRLRVALGDIVAKTGVTVKVSLEKTEKAMLNSRGFGQASPLVRSSPTTIWVTFTYDQQITPQSVTVDPEQVTPASTEAPAEVLMPITGGGLTTNLILPLLLVLVLVAAGGRALRTRG
jgi:hypothetical protein